MVGGSCTFAIEGGVPAVKPEDDFTRSRLTLPVLGQPAAERADAARNRHALLSIARTIVTKGGVDALSMDGLAVQAGVGVGTVYRRFKDRAGLAYALLDHEERRFQEAFLFGPPPLGPGAPPVVRIRAFLHAYIDRLETQAELHLFAESHSPKARYNSGVYRTHRTHLAALLTLAQPNTAASYLADALLAVLGAGLFLHQRRELQLSTDQMKAGLDRLLRCLPPG